MVIGLLAIQMADASETKVTRRDAISTTGRAAVAFGAAALLAGRLPKIQPLYTAETEDDDMDEQEQQAAGLATAAVTYVGNDDDETGGGFENPGLRTDELGRVRNP